MPSSSTFALMVGTGSLTIPLGPTEAMVMARVPPGFAPESPPNLLPTFTNGYILTLGRD